jgi:uncharacterized protein YkwD
MFRCTFVSLFATVLLIACSDPVEPQTAANADLQFCLDETNRYRAMDGRGPIERSAAIEEYAAIGAALDTEQERAHGHFGDTSGGNGLAFAENACPSWLGWSLGDGPDAVHEAIADCIEAFYKEGPGDSDKGHGHYNNLMGDLPKLGCGIYVKDGGITIIQDFGP